MNQKTQPQTGSVTAFVESLEEKKQVDTRTLIAMMQEITGHDPVLWGPSMIGFGQYHYRYDSGREGDWFITGFAPRKQHFAIYIMPGFSEYKTLLEALGKYKTGKSCLYVNKLADVDQSVLRKLIAHSVKTMRERYGS